MTLVTAGEEHEIEIPQEEKRPLPDDVAFVYIGRSFVPGMPARDLTHEEAERIGRERIRGIKCAHDGQPLYREV